jgi:hypothetical protein
VIESTLNTFIIQFGRIKGGEKPGVEFNHQLGKVTPGDEPSSSDVHLEG